MQRNQAGSRLLHVVGDSAFGGGAKIIRALGSAAVDAGYDVDVLTSDDRFRGELEGTGLRPVDLDVIVRQVDPVRDIAGLIALTRFMRRTAYDLVHTHTSKAGVIGRLAAATANTQTVVHTVHGFAYHRGTARPLKAAATVAEVVAARACDAVVTVGRYQVEALANVRAFPARKLVHIPNGIPDPRSGSARDPVAVRAELGLAATQAVLVCHGRLVPSKALDVLLHSLEYLAAHEMHPACLVVGDGPMRSALEEVARARGLSDHVVFTGFRRDVADLVAAADVVVLPTYREGLSIALLEALAAGRAIVTTDIPGNVEAADGAAVLVPTGDPVAIGRAVAELLTRPERRAELETAARARYEARYSETAMATSYLRLYQSLRSGSRAA